MIIVGGSVLNLAVTVEADFSGTAFCGTPTWTDITQYVITSSETPGGSPVTISWGRQDWLGDMSPSEMHFTVMNADGRFTPGNQTLSTGGANPYYPNVKRRTRIRCWVSIAGSPVFLFDGYVDDWTATPANGTYWTTPIDATDILGRMGNTTEFASFLTEEVSVDSPSFLYPMQEAEGSTSFGDVTGQATPLLVVNSKYGAGEVDAGQSPTGDFVAGNVVTLTSPAYPSNASHTAGSWLSGTNTFDVLTGGTIEMWAGGLTGSTAVAQASLFSSVQTSGFSLLNYVQLEVALAANGTGSILCTLNTTPGLIVLNGTTNVCDGNMHHVVVTVGADQKTGTLYVDGAVDATFVSSAALGTIATGRPFSVGMAQGLGSPTEPLSGSVAYLAVYPAALSSLRVLSHYAAGASAFNGESTAAHFARILGYRPNLGSVIDPTLGFVGSEDIQGSTEQASLLDTAQAEGGTAFADGQGRMNLRSRSRFFNPLTALTLDAVAGQIDVATTFRDDIQYEVNKITVSRPGGADQVAQDTASIAQDGETAQSVSANIDTDAHALDLANWDVAMGTIDGPELPNLTVNLLTAQSSALTLGVLQLRPLDVVKALFADKRSPGTSMTAMVQGGEITIAADQIEAELLCTPLPPPVLTSDGIVNGVTVAADTTDSATFVAAY